jgi:NitT/TauT family transport system ATP-binding protein
MNLTEDSRSPSILTAQGVGFAYSSGREVFRDFCVSIRPGEFVALLGPSGCGKTTLLNLLSGFLKPTIGSIRINGEAVLPEMAALGYVFQSPNLFPWLSVLENVRFGLRMAGRLNAAEQRQKARRYLALVGLEDTADELPHRLSGGMRQRVALARSLALEPSLLLMDEPFAALDAITRINMNEELLRLWAELGQAIVFITHDIDEAVFLADRVVLLGLPPNGIDSQLAIDLPRPRDRLGTRLSPRFAEYGEELMRRIGSLTGTRLPNSQHLQSGSSYHASL